MVKFLPVKTGISQSYKTGKSTTRIAKLLISHTCESAVMLHPDYEKQIGVGFSEDMKKAVIPVTNTEVSYVSSKSV